MNINIEVDESKIKKIGTIRVDLKEAKQIGKIDIPVIKGDSGKDGKDGQDGQNGKDGKDGKDGANGKDGVNGKDGQNGADGKDGISIVSVEQIVESTESNGINQIEVLLSNGNSSIFNVRNGKEGESGGGGTDYDDTELRRLINEKVDKETGKSLIEDTEIERLSKVKNYDDTELRGLIDETLQDAKDYTDTEIANFDFVKIVNTLPDVGLPNKVYFVPKEESETNNIFEEYAWINGAWEYFGTKTVEVDLTDVNAQLENLSKNKADKTEILTKTSQLENDSGFITEEDVPESDGILTGSVIGWNKEIIPEGYEEVEGTTTGTTLYESTTFASTGTLSDSIINYKRIKVYVRNSDWLQVSEEFLVDETATSTTPHTISFWSGSYNNIFYGKAGRLIITDKTFTLDRLVGVNLSNSKVEILNSNNAYVVMKIVGFTD